MKVHFPGRDDSYYCCHRQNIPLESCRYSDIFLVNFHGEQRILKCPNQTMIDEFGSSRLKKMYASEYFALSRHIEGTPYYYDCFTDSGSDSDDSVVITDDFGNVCAVYPCGLLQEYISGQTWDCLNTLSDHQFWLVLREITSTIQRSNLHGIYHLDISRRNIILRTQGDQLVAVLIDFTGCHVSGRDCGSYICREGYLLPRPRGNVDYNSIAVTQARMVIDFLPDSFTCRNRQSINEVYTSGDPLAALRDLISGFIN